MVPPAGMLLLLLVLLLGVVGVAVAITVAPPQLMAAMGEMRFSNSKGSVSLNS